MIPIDRTLQPKERKDGKWAVEVRRPDVAPMDIGDFQSESEAIDWIVHESDAYFRDRERGFL
jgi:hypothetical protein